MTNVSDVVHRGKAKCVFQGGVLLIAGGEETPAKLSGNAQNSAQSRGQDSEA